MKKVKFLLFAAATMFLVSSCQNDDESSVGIEVGEGMTAVNFKLDGSAIQHQVMAPLRSTRAYTPTYEKNNFSIYAFRRNQDSTAFLYEKTINLSKMTYADNVLTGSDVVPIGVYKFIPVYGLNNQSNRFTMPGFNATTTLGDNLNVVYNGSGPLSEVFMQTDANASTLAQYRMGFTEGTNPTVEATINRAVSRVDVMFIKASKSEDGVYTEQPYKTGANALGNKSVASIQLAMTNLKTTMNMFGVVDDATTVNRTVTLTSPNAVIGNSTSTTIGTSGYLSYNDIQTEDIIKGGAYITGTYLIPNSDNDKNTALNMTITSTDGITRTINVSGEDESNLLPLERNKVTIVKIYVLDDDDDDDDDDDPDVFNTKVNFEVTINTDWLSSNEVIGEIE